MDLEGEIFSEHGTDHSDPRLMIYPADLYGLYSLHDEAI